MIKNISFILAVLTSIIFAQSQIYTVLENYPDGQPKLIHYYKKSDITMNLVKVENYYEGGQLKKIEHYKEGVLHRSSSIYSQEGDLFYEEDYNMGVFLGDTLKTFYPDLSLESYFSMKDGNKNGSYVLYDTYGKEIEKGNYLNNQKIGEWVRWFNHGNNGMAPRPHFPFYIEIEDEGFKLDWEFTSKLTLDRDKIITTYHEDQMVTSKWYIDDVLIMEDSHLHGQKHGEWKYYDQTLSLEEPAYISFYEKGQIIKESLVNFYIQPAPSKPSTPIASDEDFDDEEYDIFETDFDEFEDWDAPPPYEEEEGNSDFIAYDKAPVAVIPISPAFPEIAKSMGTEGKVYVKFFVDKKGRVDPNKIIVVKGVVGLNEAAIEAVKRSKWKPAMQRDRKVGVYMTVPVNFVRTQSN